MPQPVVQGARQNSNGAQAKNTQMLPQINLQLSPRKDAGYDYVSLGSRIQDQIKGVNAGAKHPRQNKNLSMQPPISRGSQGANNGVGGRPTLQTPNNQLNQTAGSGIKAMLQGNYGTQSASQTPHATNFENYLKKVIKSVERRKAKNFQLDNPNQTQRLNQLMEIDYQTDLKIQNKNASYGILSATSNQGPAGSFQNFQNSLILPGKQESSTNSLQGKQQFVKPSTLREYQLAIVEESRVGDDSFVNVTGKVTDNNELRSDGGASSLRNSKRGSYQRELGQVPSHPYQLALLQDGRKKPEHNATEQVVQLLKETQKKEKIFIPLERSTDVSSGYMYHEMKNPPENHAGIVVFSKQGFVTVGKERNATSNFVSNNEYITNGVNQFILSEVPFFKKFQMMRLFKQWKYIMRWNFYQRKREKLAETFFFAKPIFSEKYSKLINDVNTIRTLPFMEIKKNVTYGKKQQSMLDERCSSKLTESKERLDKLLGNIKHTIYNLKVEIQNDDKTFENSIKEMKVQAMIKQKRHGEELLMFSKARKQKEIEEEQKRIQRIRHIMYDKFVEFVLKFVCGNLVELLFENKHLFKEIFKDLKSGPQFEASVCFNTRGRLDTDPSMEDHYASFLLVFENMEKAVYQNQTLIEFIADIFSQLYRERKVYYKNLFNAMEHILRENKAHQQNNDVIFETLKKDITKCREYLEQFVPLQEIYDFAKDWETNKKDQQLSSEMGFYKETWVLMDRYNSMIDKIPAGNTKLGTILVETLSLKKYLHELPKRVIDSIRHNVTLTMETETKSLREELSKTSEILDQLPTSLNVYVEQVNTLKYVKEKQEDFSQKFQTINKLHQLCKQDNIKVSLTLQLAIDEVSHLYESLPKLQRTAAEGLSQNKDTMEKIMQSSSLVLSKKIKAFEKKYVETYLQDKSRLEDCADTLEELFKRSKAIHEIRSKVILYKEFLKLLYEDDPDAELKLKKNKLQCADDYEFVQSIHKETIKLWKMLLYWRKRRQMCYNSPFLQLDTNKIIRSINKINKYFEEKLSKNQFLREKSRPLCKVVILQVKETSLIIEFLKDLRKESLQQRHWLQIFNLIKAPHLKNSNSFTIVNLKEYHIQNYREEIAVIIEHANTELKYERIFKSIKEEWEALELKIIPYKESMDSYILINTDTLSNAIEENLTTLETISQSKYAEHVRQDISDWMKTLKVMLKNLEVWIVAQKHWINLDPIFQSAQLEDILGHDSTEFQEYRNQFKRIMWSAFKNPKATYNLMISNRIEVFENLIKYFSVLQKKVHEYLEQRRLAFPRFFFLSDSQFLDFLTLSNSNQDFNDYISILFQGAKSLYINRVLGNGKTSAALDDPQIDNLLRIGEEMNDFKMKSISERNSTQPRDADILDQDVPTPYMRKAFRDRDEDKTTIQVESMSQEDISIRDRDDQYSANSESNIKQRAQNTSAMTNEYGGGVRLGLAQKEKDEKGFQILGMIGHCKELFLFERTIPMKDGVEHWLQRVEEAMQETVAKQINYAVSSFPKQSLDEWILDYPQQVILSTIHLILSHEINELLEEMADTSNNLGGGEEADNASDKNDDEEEDQTARSGKTGGDNTRKNRQETQDERDEESSHVRSSQSKSRLKQSKRNNLSSAGHGTFSKKSSKKAPEDDDDSGIKDYIKKKNELKAQQKAEEEMEKRRLEEEQRLKKEANEPPKDPEKEKRKFLDEMFGRDFPVEHYQLKDQIQHEKSESDPLVPKKPPTFKETVMTLLQRKSFQGLFLRLQFWINQIVKSLFPFKYGQLEKFNMEIQLHSVQKLIMKNIISFLIFQREIVENLIRKGVTSQNDFEWQSQVRLLWTGVEPGCRVDCGGWSTYQQNEYLGNAQRLVMTPLTNRYFVFMSAALREKSAVMFKCSPSEQMAGDIFEEFATICSVPYRRIQCNPVLQMKTMMQYLNGSALASVWIFFEHFDKLPYSHFAALNKEIQMVQQQFIIAELSANDNQNASLSKASHSQLRERNMVIKENTNQLNGVSSATNKKIVSQLSSMPQSSSVTAINQRSQYEKSAMGDQTTPKTQNDQAPFTKAAKICFGVFGSVSHGFLINHSELAQQLLNHSQSAFRVVALTRPNELQMLKVLFKTHGFDFYEQLALKSFACLEKFNEQKAELESKIEASDQLQIHENFTLSDMWLVSKLAKQFRRFDYWAYLTDLKLRHSQNLKREVLGITLQKTRDDKIADLEKLDARIADEKVQRLKVELNAVKSTLHLFLMQKYTRQWIAIYELVYKFSGYRQNQLESNLESVVQQCLDQAFKSEEDEAMFEGLTAEQKSLIQLVNIKKQEITNSDLLSKYQLNNGSLQLVYNKIQEGLDQRYYEKINNALKVVIEKLNYDKVYNQVKSCIQFIDFLGRKRAIALVGPTCSGKTSILKIVSNVVNLAFNVKMRTSVINSPTYTRDELYGTTEAFSSSQKGQEAGNSFNKQGIFQIILDVFEKERNQLSDDEKRCLVQSIFLDSSSIDSVLCESLMDYIYKSNKKESSRHNVNLRKILDLDRVMQASMEESEECIPVTMPNSNVIQFPQSLYIFFEATTLKDSSPAFVSRIGLIVTEEDELSWKNLMMRQRSLCLKRHAQFFKDKNLNFKLHYDDCWRDFIEPFLEVFLNSPKVQANQFFRVKASVLQFFNLLNSMIYRIQEICLEKGDTEDPSAYMLNELERDVFWSSILLSLIWSFGAPVNRECRKVFEENFFNYRRKFNINISGPGKQRFTLFDIYYDPDNLQWDLLQEKLEYKLKLHYDAQYGCLMIPTVEVSQSYFLMDIILGSLKHDDSLDKHFRLLGPSGTSKSTALNTFIKKYSDQYNSIIVPMCSYLTLDKLKQQVESLYHAKRRNQLEPLDKHKKLIFIIDDLHLQSNLKFNVLEFLRTWCVSKGYYDIKQGFFKNIGEFGTIMAENSDYRTSYCKVEGKTPTQSRFLFYANTLYIDEYDFDRYKLFIQHWLTSKMWSTSKIINKYYILMTNTIMTLMDKLKRQEYFHNATFLRLTNFHIFSKFCSNLANYTLISDETKEIVVKGQKEEDAASNMMIYELMRSIGDRIMIPNYRNNFILRMVDACKQEFITGNYLSPKYCDEMLLGNYHNRRPGAHIKYLNMNNDFAAVRQEIREKIRKCSNNHFLETFLDAPNGPKEIFRLSRILFKEMQHLILIGHAGSGMHEYLQLAAILNDGLIFELNVAKFGEPVRFAQVFKQAILSAVQLNSFAFLIINDQQIRDSSYIDYTYNFITNIIKNENCILMDQDFKHALIDIEKDLANSTQGRKVHETVNNEVLFLQALRKIQKNVHIVFMINEHSTYYEWVSLFPALEHKCEVIYMDELSSEGYRQMTAEFFTERDTDNSILNNQNLIKALVEARQITKHKIISLFYSQQMLQFTCNEEYISTQQGEYVFNSDKKLHGFLYENGVNSVVDPSHKQLNYNVPVQISFLYKTRFVMFLELFRFLYDFLSMNLIIRRNYYETFLRKASEFQDFFKDIKSTKSVLHNESNQITYKLATLKDKIFKIQQLIFEKESTIGRRLKDIADLEIELKNNKDELNSVVYEKDKNIDDILTHLEKINGSEFSYVINTSHYKPNERALLDLFAMVIEKESRVTQYDKKQFDMYFLNREELIHLLNDRRSFDYDEPCFTRLKDFINQFAVNDFKDRPLMKQLFNFLMELYRKLNVRNTMSGAIARIKEIKEQIDSSHFSINYSRQFIEDKKEEMEGLKSKFERIKDQEQSLSKRIEEAEISHMRTEHIFMQVEKYTNKIYAKLTEVKRRIECLLGDCIIMASSVIFLGVFSIKERLQTRKEIFDYVTNGCNIQCSQCWNEVNPALNNQSLLFKQVIKEYGLRKVIQTHNYSGILSQPIVVEALFSMIFAPSCPYIVDPTGQLEEFIESKVLSNLKIKQIYGSDRSINSQLEGILRSQAFALLNDVNDMSKDTFGLCHDQPLIHRLCTTTHNGFDFDYERLTKLKQLHALNAYHNSYQSVNKRISTNTPEYENLSFYQVQVFTPRFEFTLNREFHSKATVFLAMNNDAEVVRGDLATAPWVDIKELMLKHFLPESYKQLLIIQTKLKELELKKSELNKNFENLFLVANQDTLQNIMDYSELKQSVEDIRYSQEERRSYQKNLQDLLNENSLLNSYANVLTIMYVSLKKLSKVSGDITYSWKMFLSIIDQVLLKIVRDLNSEQLQLNKKKHETSSGSISVTLHGHAGLKSKNLINPAQIMSTGNDVLDQKEFTIDEDFFSTIIIPGIYQVVISSVKQVQVAMYNLILSILIAQKKKEITEAESEFFFKNLFAIKDFHLWRNSERNFVDLDTKIEKSKFYAFKREILKIYPDIARKVMEYVEKDCGQTFSYKLASLTIYGKIFQQLPEFKNLTLMQKINIGFLCPDHEFTSKICQLVYEQLTSIFSFSEELVKLHHFIKTASWQQPIALLSQNQINIINTVCSIASYYGVGLEVLRTDTQSSEQQSEKNQNSTQNKYIVDNLQDYSKIADQTIDSYRLRLNKEAATYAGSNKRSIQICDTKINYDSIVEKDGLGIDDRQLSNNSTQEVNPLKMIENCAVQGSWVFISTLIFPSFWLKMCTLLDNLKAQNKISNSFRVFVDLQGYQQNEIPDSFLFNHSISFYLTDLNNEDMEGFNDMWANILNDKILADLAKNEGTPENEEVKKEEDPFGGEEDGIDQNEALQLLQGLQVTTQDKLIKNEQHREQYLGFLKNQMMEDSKNESNTLIFGSEPTIEIRQEENEGAKTTSGRERAMNEVLSDIKSINSNSQDQTNAYKNQQSWKDEQNQVLSQEQLNDGQQLREGNDNEDGPVNIAEQPLVSRINSAQNSMDLSKGENQLIMELQSQFEETKGATRLHQSRSIRQSNLMEPMSDNTPTVAINQEQDQEQQNYEEEQNQAEFNFEGITEKEADEAFDEFQKSNNDVSKISSANEAQNLDDTSGLL